MPSETNPLAAQLQQQIQDRQARVAVMGLGYVGLPLLASCFKAGYAVLGFDVSAERVAALQAGQSPVQDVNAAQIQQMNQSQRVLWSCTAADLARAEIVLICVPTPLHKSKEPDLSFIVQATETLSQILRPGQLIILESTTYPGTSDEVLLPAFAATGQQLDQDFLLAFSPERIDPGNPTYRVENIPKVVGGVSPVSGEVASAFYQRLGLPVHTVSSARVAETAKILENTFRSVNIALVNEFAGICRALEIDVWEVIEAAATKPFGFMKFLPGPGIGGHCIPLDPHYLIWKARLHGFEPRFMGLADQINSQMPLWVVQRATEVLNLARKALNGSRIGVLGVAYKANIDDARESPAHAILPLLREKGAEISYHDPFVPQFEAGDRMFHSQAFDSAFLAQDLILILTDHAQLDYARVLAEAPLILDTRNALASRLPEARQCGHLHGL
jgi:UDP-N-acetyl-D-glucosamine dehydrogenase